ncbi:MAG: Zn-ribbon domain-containing OB-fold protein [Anaerolineales bacterium]|nr:Zn-ribbon domain-containing OB-fold protein [Anaerolineales bacterium]
MEIPRHWRLKKQRYGLVGEVCPHCEYKIFPPRDVCPNCGDEAKEQFAFSGKGEVYSFTTVYEAPAGFDANAPYTVAIVKLEEGPMLTAQLTDLGEQPIEIGMPVEMVTRKMRNDGDERGLIVYGYKFRPAVIAPIMPENKLSRNKRAPLCIGRSFISSLKKHNPCARNLFAIH